MPRMSRFEAAWCRSAPWRGFAGHVLLPWAMQGHEPGGEVLELGSGSGAMAAVLLGRYPSITMTVTDIDPEMVTAAKQRLAPFGDRVNVQQADASQLVFDDDRFDTVLSFIMLHHVVDWERALSEAVRVLRPGGRLIGYDLLANRVMELLGQAEGEGFRMMRLADAEQRFAELPVAATLRPSFARYVLRFRAIKRTV